MKFTEEQIKKIAEVAQKDEFFSELLKAQNAADVKNVFSKFGLEFTENEICDILNVKLDEVNAVLEKVPVTFELSDLELDDVVGGSFWSVFKTAVSFVPVVGTCAKLVCDLADGSLKGTENIAARVGITLAVGLFDAVTTIATGGAAAIAKTAITQGIKAVGGRIAVYAGVTALSAGSSQAVDYALAG